MKKFKSLVIVIMLIVVLIAGIFVGNKTQMFFKPTHNTTIIQTGIEEKISKIGELASVEDYYTNSALQTDSKRIKDWDVPFTKKRFIVKYSGTIKAGIDISKVTVSVKEKKIHINLPEAQILSHEIDENSLEVLDESKNIFNPITISDYNNFQKEQKKIVEKSAIEKGLLNRAGSNAEDIIKMLLSSIDGIDDYEIVFS